LKPHARFRSISIPSVAVQWSFASERRTNRLALERMADGRFRDSMGFASGRGAMPWSRVSEVETVRLAARPGFIWRTTSREERPALLGRLRSSTE